MSGRVGSEFAGSVELGDGQGRRRGRWRCADGVLAKQSDGIVGDGWGLRGGGGGCTCTGHDKRRITKKLANQAERARAPDAGRRRDPGCWGAGVGVGAGAGAMAVVSAGRVVMGTVLVLVVMAMMREGQSATGMGVVVGNP